MHAANDDHAGAQEREERREQTPLRPSRGRRRRRRPVTPRGGGTSTATSRNLTTPEPAELPLLRRHHHRHRRRRSPPPPRSPSGSTSEPHGSQHPQRASGRQEASTPPRLTPRSAVVSGEETERRPANPKRWLRSQGSCLLPAAAEVPACWATGASVYSRDHAPDMWASASILGPHVGGRATRSRGAWLGMTCGPVKTVNRWGRV